MIGLKRVWESRTSLIRRARRWPRKDVSRRTKRRGERALRGCNGSGNAAEQNTDRGSRHHRRRGGDGVVFLRAVFWQCGDDGAGGRVERSSAGAGSVQRYSRGRGGGEA